MTVDSPYVKDIVSLHEHTFGDLQSPFSRKSWEMLP